MAVQESAVSPKSIVLICLLLTAIILPLYAPVVGFDFVNLDDDVYVTGNPHIQNGLTLQGIKWALQADLVFDSPNADYWQPATFISRMIDISVFGLKPFGHHVMNLLFHLANTLLLFGLLRRMTNLTWPSFAAALLFSVHPLTIEPVAWITARKDLLSWFFGLLSLHTYYDFVKNKKNRQAILSTLFFLCGLMSKPSLVSLPFLLIILDFWPLRRFSQRSFKEKWFYFMAAAPFFVIPFIGQGQAFRYASPYIVAANAVVNVVTYLWKAICPVNLAVLSAGSYAKFPAVPFVFSILFLLGVTFLLIKHAKTKPYLLAGWLWFLISLFPMAAIAPVADRFMYVPIIGLLVLFVWAIDLHARKIALPMLFIFAASFLFLSSRQLAFWKNNEVLFQNSIDASSGNFIAHNNLAITMIQQGKLNQAEELYSEANKIRPDVVTNTNFGSVLAQQGKIEEAMKHFEESLRLNPNYAEAHNNLANLLIQQGRTEEAVSHYLKAVKLKPELPEAHANLGFYYANQREDAKAISYLSETIRLKPEHAKAHFYLASLLMENGQSEESVKHFKEAVRLNPGDAQIQNNFGIALASLNRHEEAEPYFKESIRLAPDYADAYYNLGVLYSRQNQIEQAIQYLKEAIRVRPHYPKAQDALNMLQSRDMESKNE